MIEQIKRVVAEFMASFSPTKYGIISAYDPNNYTVKVRLQPEDIETGFVPLSAVWVGNNLGAVFGPAIGDIVRLDFIEGSAQATVVGARFFDLNNRPPVVQSGQAAIVDGAGSYIRLNGDGTITWGASTSITADTPLFKVTGDISDQNGAHGTLKNLREAHNGHTHTEHDVGGQTSGPSITV